MIEPNSIKLSEMSLSDLKALKDVLTVDMDHAKGNITLLHNSVSSMVDGFNLDQWGRKFNEFRNKIIDTDNAISDIVASINFEA